MNKLSKIALSILGISGVGILGYSIYDTCQVRKDIVKEAVERNVSVYEVAKERGRSDVVDMQMLKFWDAYGEKHIRK